MRFDRIVIGIDFTTASVAAARWVAGHFAPRAELVLVHVVDVPEHSALRGERAEDVAIRRDTLRAGAIVRLGDVARSLDPMRVIWSVVEGDPPGALVREAARLGANLVVVGAHGRRPGPWNLLGTSAEAAIALSDIPVLVAIGMRDATPRNVLAAIGNRGIAPEMTDALRTLHAQLGAHVTLFHAIAAALPIDGAGPIADPKATEDVERGVDEWADGICDDRLPRAAVSSAVMWGDAGMEIVAAAERLGSDVVVLARDRDARVRHALAGSVTREVVRHGRSPVLVIPTASTHGAGAHAVQAAAVEGHVR